MCAVDSVTKKCAGPTEGCRSAMLRILGTKLRTSCACNGTDFTQLYDCLGWQRILWVNPCVGKFVCHRINEIQQINNKTQMFPDLCLSQECVKNLV